jgi:hypothetical protein
LRQNVRRPRRFCRSSFIIENPKFAVNAQSGENPGESARPFVKKVVLCHRGGGGEPEEAEAGLFFKKRSDIFRKQGKFILKNRSRGNIILSCVQII